MTEPQYEQGRYGQPPYPQMPPNAGQYPAPGQFVPHPPLGVGSPPPETAQTTAILATTFGALLVASIVTALVGIAPLILGVMALSKANSVTRLWSGGQYDAAQAAASESHRWARWAWIGMGIGAVVSVVALIGIVAAVAA